ncbi:MAG: metalloregulator ArsR/SmtB family transcription factor [Desulfurivibrio sp.]|nr:metalloregulator ArsR/SmtB family transcription factor [Desulfurivibrio sp.]
MKDLLKVTKALADPGRLKIVKLLQHRELCVCELQTALGLAQPTVSRHLVVLEEAGLIRRRKDGLWVNYSLAGDDSPYAAALLDLLRGWLNDDPELSPLLAELPGIDRRTICEARKQKSKSSPRGIEHRPPDTI